MSYASLLAGAAKTAQAVLASIADPEGEGQFTLAGTTYTGIIELKSFTLRPGQGGVVRIADLEIMATAAQFAALPNPAPRLAVTALGKNWWCIDAEPAGPFYRLSCVAK